MLKRYFLILGVLAICLLPITVLAQSDIPDGNKMEDFGTTWILIQNSYVDGPIPDETLYEGAIKGLVQSLNDPHSAYFNEAEYQELITKITGSFVGIGIEFKIKDKYPCIMNILKNSPASKANLKAGDFIIKADGQSLKGMPDDKIVMKIKGHKGTKVKLTIAREGEKEFLEIEIERDEIQLPMAEYKLLENDTILYLNLLGFSDEICIFLQKTLLEIKDKKIEGIILDLRGNSGGYIEVAVAVSSLWISKEDGLIVKQVSKNKRYQRDHYPNFKGQQPFAKTTTVILVDEGSASASEIVAGCLKDYQKATLIGKKTYGKGSVQIIFKLGKSALKLTVAKWLTPKGTAIDKEGIAPDIEIKEEAKDGKDPCIEKALEILKNKDKK